MYKFNDNEPIYLQLMNIIKQQIIVGTLEKGHKIKSVRDLALEYGVNPNTVQKSLSELEREGWLESLRTSGRFVLIKPEATKDAKAALIKSKTADYVNWLRTLNLSDSEIKTALNNYLKSKGGSTNE